MGFKVLKALKRGDEGVTFSCVDFLCALMQPMHDNYDLRYEQLNKSSLLFSAKFVQSLLDTLKEHIVCSYTGLGPDSSDLNSFLVA